MLRIQELSAAQLTELTEEELTQLRLAYHRQAVFSLKALCIVVSMAVGMIVLPSFVNLPINPLTTALPVLTAPFSITYLLFRFGKAASLEKDLTPIAELNDRTCSWVREIIENSPRARNWAQAAVSQGRQLRKFDADEIIRLYYEELASTSELRRLEDCKAIHGLAT